MTHTLTRSLLGCAFLLAGWCVLADEPKADPKGSQPNLSEYRTVDQAKTAPIAPARSGMAGYLGVFVERDSRGRLVVEGVQPESPADMVGIKKGDVVTT